MKKGLVRSLAVIVIGCATLGVAGTSIVLHLSTEMPAEVSLQAVAVSLPEISEPEPEPPSGNVTLALGGDVMMGDLFGEAVKSNGADYPWKQISPILSGADLAMVNLETCVSDRGASTKPEGFGFQSLPATLKGFQSAGIDLVVGANNHSMDYGKDAFFDTMLHLDQAGIAYAGIGKNAAEARQVRVFEKNGLKVGVVAYNQIIPAGSWIAREDSPGQAALTQERLPQVLEEIAQARKQCDYLVVYLHWGQEYVDTPSAWQTTAARKMLDAGADLIAGCHPHVTQGIEFYRGKPILYSMGNFLFLKRDDDAGKTAVFELTINKDGFVSGKLYPFFISGCRGNLLGPDDAMYGEVIHRIGTLSSGMGTMVTPDGQFYAVS